MNNMIERKSISEKALRQTQDIENAKTTLDQKTKNNMKRPSTWRRLEPNWCKVNTDGLGPRWLLTREASCGVYRIPTSLLSEREQGELSRTAAVVRLGTARHGTARLGSARGHDRGRGDGTLFNVDTVQRILVNFSQQDDSEENLDDASVFEFDSPRSPSQTALFKVAILVDNYLAEIAPDANLKLAKFMAVAETLPEHARTTHDGLYRAIYIYLKAHQGLLDEDKKKLCKLIDFQKLSQEAGPHAAQNERLHIQSIVQVLYFEQLRLRNALCCSFPEEDTKLVAHHHSWTINSGAHSAAMSPRDNYASLRRENRELKLELTRMRMRLNDLEKDHVCIRRDMVKSRSHKFMRSFSKKMGKLSLFGHSSSRGSISLQGSHTELILR
ncbi:BTB/POZ domain-containing protein [Hibiscus syriacus]|uniref:BTB/POZ domain-containing protein n=1 Tax=Hibiscus syriacus TaxID=106335 RepID=A0A6A3ATV2_HIBSY|nr:BTB/POZ domain-containing protein [Hibiscus syriacus]